MKIRMIAAVAAGLACGPLGFAQSGAAVPPAVAAETTSYTGEVREFTAGNVLEVDLGDKRSKVYDLKSTDTIYRIDPSLSKGSKVAIVEGRDAQGRKIVSVSPQR